MNEKINPTLKVALNGNYRFNFENYISRGFDIVGKYSAGFIGFTLLFFVFSSIRNQIPNFGSLIFSLIFSPPLMAGFYIAASRISFQEPLNFDDFFNGFKDIQQLVIIAVIQTGLSMAITIPFALIFGGMDIISPELFSGDPAAIGTMFSSFMIMFFLIMIPIVYFYVSWVFAPMFVVFYKMQAWEAMETSRKIVNRKWFSFFGFQFVLGLIIAAGLLMICVGVLYTFPAAMAANYVAFEDITKFYEENEGDIIDHLVDEDIF